MNEPRDFNELVSWASWQVIEGMTQGRPLRGVMHAVLMGALAISAEWKKTAPKIPTTSAAPGNDNTEGRA